MKARVTLSVIFQTEKKQRIKMASGSQNRISIRKDRWGLHNWNVGVENASVDI
jgi:hypothetical protein